MQGIAEDVSQGSGAGQILLAVFEILDGAAIPYCVLHGYEDYPERINSDVDCLIAAEIHPSQLSALLYENSTRISADLVRSRGYNLVLAGKNANGSPCFLALDLSTDYALEGRPVFAGSEVLGSRRKYNQFWVPAASAEFVCYLSRKIVKRYLNNEHTRRLTNLYQEDVAGCRGKVARLWSARSAALILFAANSGDWEPVRRQLGKLRAELLRRATLRSPFRVAGNRLFSLSDKMMRWCWPDGGLNVAFLGPDGAGKSSVILAVGQTLTGPFAHTDSRTFAPGLLHRLLHRPKAPNNQPHGLPPRSFGISVLRAVFYWLPYYTFGYITVRLALARSTLLLHDRHLVDALVDPKRYRYGGPPWLLHLIWRLIPKPDLVILLDAPAEVLQARKQEVPFEETARQREAYLSLIRTIRNGCVVDANRPLEQVVRDVDGIILRHLTTRIARRLGLKQKILYGDRQVAA